MGKGGPPDLMIERGRDRSGDIWRRKHSKERESGVSEWKSAEVWSKQKGVEIERKRERKGDAVHSHTSHTPTIIQQRTLTFISNIVVTFLWPQSLMKVT